MYKMMTCQSKSTSTSKHSLAPPNAHLRVEIAKLQSAPDFPANLAHDSRFSSAALQRIDSLYRAHPASASSNRRIQRAIEVILQSPLGCSTSIPIPAPIHIPTRAELPSAQLAYDVRALCVHVPDRDYISRSIDLRCEQMISRGLLSEVAGLMRRFTDDHEPVRTGSIYDCVSVTHGDRIQAERRFHRAMQIAHPRVRSRAGTSRRLEH